MAERNAILYTLRENQVARLDMFPDRDAALKAVGLEELGDGEGEVTHDE